MPDRLNQVVSGEPSLGTPHLDVANTSILNDTVADTNWHSIDLVALGVGDIGIKGITFNAKVTAGYSISWSDASAGTVWAVTVNSATDGEYHQAFCPISSSGLLWWKGSSASISSALANTVLYWI
jgi:hypothetical protein